MTEIPADIMAAAEKAFKYGFGLRYEVAIKAIAQEIHAERERASPPLEESGWQPISTCPIRTSVDLWCVYGGEEFARYDGGAPIGKLVSDRHRTEEYGFFGNQSNDGVPQRDGPDLIPVAWRKSVPYCPPELIAEALGIPLTREEALAAPHPPSVQEKSE